MKMLPDELPYKGSVKRVLMQAPTANVVPKIEVAREIFEEIEKYNRPPLRECEPVYIIKAREFAELKKKYTEDTPDGKRTDR